MSVHSLTTDSRGIMVRNLRSRRSSTLLALMGILLLIAIAWRFFDRAQWWWLWGL
jgi:hypothetical protein